MAKTKWQNGWLCGTTDGIDFWPSGAPEYSKRDDEWDRPYLNGWFRSGFTDAYKLRDEHGKPCALPKPGESFEIELQV